MGVQGLWQLLNPTGRPVSLQSLEGKILAVDVSIWLHQAVKGMRDRDGNPLPNAHLQVLFNRLCKLLYYRIKPVFVFDGGVPALKKQTMAGRRERKEFAELESDKATKNLVQNLLKSHAINEVLKDDEKKLKTSSGPKPSTSKAGKPDLFELPPLPEEFTMIDEESRRTEFTPHERMLLEDVDLNQIDIESEVFNSLPAEMKHEVLTLLKEKKKRHTWNQILELPQESNDFSKFQMQKLMKQNQLSSRLQEVKKEMNDNRSGELTSFLGDDFYSDAIETRKIMSDDSAHSILIKGLGSKEQKEEMERIRIELEEQNKMEEINDKREKDSDKTVEEKNGDNDVLQTKRVKFEQNDSNKDEASNGSQTGEFVEKINSIESNSSKFKGKKPLKQVQSERNNILQELQQRMNVLKEADPSNDVVLVSDQDFHDTDITDDVTLVCEKNVNVTESKKSPVVMAISDIPEEDVKIINSPSKSDGTYILTSGVKNESQIYISDKSCASDMKSLSSSLNEGIDKSAEMDSISVVTGDHMNNKHEVAIEKSKTEMAGKNLQNSKISQHSNHSASGDNSDTDIVSKRQSILNELRQKVNVLSANVELEEDMKALDEKSMEYDKESKLLDVKQGLEENRKAVMKKQLSIEEEQTAKKPKLDDSLVDNVQKPVVVESSDSDSEDEGFIEVTVDPDEAKPDELFPADIFLPVNSDEKIMDIGNASPDVQAIESDGQEVMSQDDEISDTEAPDVQENNDIAEEEDQHIDLVQQFQDFTENDMREYQDNLEAESRDLQQERGRQERLAVSITDQMYTEAQELLELFGVPYLVSPMEAEAQCAQLDASDLTHGTITDDSDIWLFNGKRVYKNFFYQDKHVEFFSDVSIKSQLGIGREILINLALLCGSDYTNGIQGVGVITAMELLTEFPGEDLEGLRKFKKWWDAAQKQITAPLEPKIRTKLRHLEVPEGFPNNDVVQAYMYPEVDDSQERFTWGQTELDLIREFTKTKFGWSKEKCDETLLPMMKQLNLKHTQSRISNYFQPENFLQPKNIKSKRLQRALNIMQGKETPETNEKSGDLIKKSVTADVLPASQTSSMTRQSTSTAGRGRGRGKGKGKGKGKSSVGQRAKVKIQTEVNLSESSSSESSGDDLIACLDYESIVGESSGISSQANSKQGTSRTTVGETGNFSQGKPDEETGSKKHVTNAKNSSAKTANKARKTTQKKNSAKETVSQNSLHEEAVSAPSNSSLTGTSSQADTSITITGTRRTKPNVRVGKAGHATEEFSKDLPIEANTKGFLEDEVKAFDILKKTRSKTKTVQSTESKEPKMDKGKRLKKSGQSNSGNIHSKSSAVRSESKHKGGESIGQSESDKKRNLNINSAMDTNESIHNETNVMVSSAALLNRRTRSSRTGTVNRVMVVSDSDSD